MPNLLHNYYTKHSNSKASQEGVSIPQE